jgi:hypothetical protein
MRSLIRRRSAWLAIALSSALLATGCAATPQRPEVASDRSTIGPRPTPSVSVSGMPQASEAAHPAESIPAAVGHAVAYDVPLGRLPAVSELAVLARVVAVEPAILNTLTGEWDPPRAASAEVLHELYAELGPYTPIRLEVTEVLGARPQRTVEATLGQTISVTLLGGTKSFTLTEAEAKAIGLTEPVEAEGSPPVGPMPTPRAVTGPVTVRVSLRPAAQLSQGDVVIAFLTTHTIHLYPGPVPKPVSAALVPEGWGFYHAEAEAGIYRNAATGSRVTEQALREAAAALSGQAGPPESAGGSY